MSANPADPTYSDVIEQASQGLSAHFDEMERSGRLRPDDLAEARRSVLPHLKAWLQDPAVDRLSPRLKPALVEAVRAGRWDGLVNAFIREVRFGTGGIRALMGFDKESIVALQECADLDAPILRGPNTINNIVVLKAAHGVGRFLAERPERWSQEMPTAVVGFDSRTKGGHFARAVTEMLLADGLSVYLFDEAVPYPEVTFAIPHLRADVGHLHLGEPQRLPLQRLQDVRPQRGADLLPGPRHDPEGLHPEAVAGRHRARATWPRPRRRCWRG